MATKIGLGCKNLNEIDIVDITRFKEIVPYAKERAYPFCPSVNLA